MSLIGATDQSWRSPLLLMMAWGLLLAPAGASAQSLPAASSDDRPPCVDNASRYVDCGDGTVTDAVTGLVWLGDAGCLGRLDWASAARRVWRLSDGQCHLTDGSRPGDWRLPTLAEWQATIARAIELGCTGRGPGGPTLTNDAGTSCLIEGPSAFHDVSAGSYWSATTNEQHPNNAWVVSLDETVHGFVFSGVKTFALPVWPVRER